MEIQKQNNTIEKLKTRGRKVFKSLQKNNKLRQHLEEDENTFLFI